MNNLQKELKLPQKYYFQKLQLQLQQVCDKTIKLKSKSNHLKTLTQDEFEKCIRIKHTIENPKIFGIVKIFNDYIIKHNKKFDLYLVKCDFKLVFNNFNPQ